MDQWKIRAAAHSAALALLRPSPHRRGGRRPLPALDRGSIRAAVSSVGAGIASSRQGLGFVCSQTSEELEFWAWSLKGHSIFGTCFAGARLPAASYVATHQPRL